MYFTSAFQIPPFFFSSSLNADGRASNISNGIADVIGGYYWGKVTPKIMPHKLLWVTPAWNGKEKKKM